MLAREAVAGFVLSAPAGAIAALSGIGLGEVRLLLEDAAPMPGGRLALAIEPTGTQADAMVAATLDALARTALALWPVWFGDVDFASCGRNAAGREVARLLARRAAAAIAGLAVPWAEAAVALALDGRVPRVPATHPGVELGQLGLAISRHGLAFVVPAPPSPSAAFVHAVEWIARTASAPVVVLLDEGQAAAPPFDRLAHGLRAVAPAGDARPAMPDGDGAARWLAPIRGRPHPLSATERRLAAALSRDDELGRLFSFNQPVDTVRGLRPRVDLLWQAGRLVVELDGYADHGTRGAFRNDRHRDYALVLSGYVVLRLANDEIAEDVAKAVEKIRDVVRLRRTSP